MRLRKDLTGQNFNRLRVVAVAGRKGAHVLWRCECQCGRATVATTGQLTGDRVKSCGCLSSAKETVAKRIAANPLAHPEATRSAIITAYQAGHSERRVAAMTGVPRPTINHILRGAGLTRARSEAAPNRTPRTSERDIARAYESQKRLADVTARAARDQSIAAAYQNETTTAKIAARFGVDKSTVVAIARRAGLPIRNNSDAHRAPVDEQFFDVIDTEEKAYWLGFITADGCVTRRHSLSVGLMATDIEHLEKLRAALRAANRVRLYSPSHSHTSGGHATHPYASFTVSSPALAAGLALHGVTPRKSFTAVAPALCPDLMRHYWRGVFDGDGGIWRLGSKPGYGASLIGSDAMVLQFRDFMHAHCGKFGGISPHRDSVGISYFRASGSFVVSRMLRVLYDGATVSLDRKRVIYEEIAAAPRRARHIITHDGLTLRICEWAERTGIPAGAIERRINAGGWAPDTAVSIPVYGTRRGRRAA